MDAFGASAIQISHGDGVRLVGTDGKRYIDWSSQAICSNLGHSVPEIADAVHAQMKQVPMLESRYFYPEVRAKLCTELARLVPGEINRFFFTENGATAVEAAARAARAYTGRPKILTRYRAYHGGSDLSLAMSGGWDPRREFLNQQHPPNLVHFVDAYPYNNIWGTADPDEERRAREEYSKGSGIQGCPPGVSPGGTKSSLAYFEEVVKMEGPHNIAAVMVEVVGGSTGVFWPSKEYLQGMQETCRKHGIVFIVDEVMTGFCRTGRWFGYQHFDLEPDIITMAKGLTAAALPMGAMGVSEKIGQYFEKAPLPSGSTYNAHPASMAASLSSCELYEKKNIAEHAARMEGHVRKHMAEMTEKHVSMHSGRCLGLMGMIECEVPQDAKAQQEAMTEFKNTILDHGLWALLRINGNTNRMDIFTTPPLIINEAEVGEAFHALDAALSKLDQRL